MTETSGGHQRLHDGVEDKVGSWVGTVIRWTFYDSIVALSSEEGDGKDTGLGPEIVPKKVKFSVFARVRSRWDSPLRRGPRKEGEYLRRLAS